MIIGALESMLSIPHMKMMLNQFIQNHKYNAYCSKDFESQTIDYYFDLHNNSKQERAVMRSFITSWTHYPGLPEVAVTPIYSSDYQMKKILLSQVCFTFTLALTLLFD